MTIDSHQHFWSVASNRYDYPKPADGVLYRDFDAHDLAPQLAATGVDRTVVVQAVEAEWETRELLSLSRTVPWIAGVVGWCDLARHDAQAVLAGYLAAGRLVGVRPMLQKQDDAGWLLAGNAARSLEGMAGRGLAFDALIDVRHVAVIAELADQHPDLQIIVDHMAKPWRLPDRVDEWSEGLRHLSKRSNCCVKVSGYPFAPAADGDGYADLCRSLLDWFGPDRLIWGSDWPVSTRHVPYEQCLARARVAFPEVILHRVCHANAVRVYGLTEAAATKE